MYIAVAGNIGSGKTTLVKLLAAHYGAQPYYEPVEDNPYLAAFYQDMQRWSFNLQMYFLNSRYEQLKIIMQSKQMIVQDRTIYEDEAIFASNLHDMGLMDARDYANYKVAFAHIKAFIQPPSLLIYLEASVETLVKNIQKRGRKYELDIREDYLEKLNKKYEIWTKDYAKSEGKLLRIKQDGKDYIANQAIFLELVSAIDQQLKSFSAKKKL